MYLVNTCAIRRRCLPKQDVNEKKVKPRQNIWFHRHTKAYRGPDISHRLVVFRNKTGFCITVSSVELVAETVCNGS